MYKSIKKLRLLIFLICFLSISLILTSCGKSELDKAVDNLSDAVASKNDNAENEENEGNGGNNTDKPSELSDFLVGPSVPANYEELIKVIALLESTDEHGLQLRIEWLGEEERNGVQTDKFSVIRQNIIEGSVELDVWIDEDSNVVDAIMADGTQYENLERAEGPLKGVFGVFSPLTKFNTVNRETFASGEVEVLSHTTEKDKLLDYDVTIHTIHAYSNSFQSEFELTIAEHEQFELYLEYIDIDVDDDSAAHLYFEVNELKFR